MDWLIYVYRSKAGEPEPGVFGSLEPEPLEEKNQEPEPEPLGKKRDGQTDEQMELKADERTECIIGGWEDEYITGGWEDRMSLYIYNHNTKYIPLQQHCPEVYCRLPVSSL